MFVRKLVRKASKKPGRNSDGLSSEEVNPRLIFHYGIPRGSILLAYDPIQKILAISTKDGRIQLVGKQNSQVLLESNDNVASKYLQFLENQGILLNVTVNNNIEVWDVERRLLSYVHVCNEEITSFTVMQHSPFMYTGDCLGNTSVLRIGKDPCHIVAMKYNIPCSASRGDIAGDIAVTHVLPQPTAESKRILIIFRDGLMALWAIRTSKSIFTAGGGDLPSLSLESKKVTSACWACRFGSKVVVGYNNGEIFIWSISPNSYPKLESEINEDLCTAQNSPIYKFNLGYKVDKIPIAMLRWTYAEGKASRLYIMGASNSAQSNKLQVILMNDKNDSRTIKLTLQPPEVCLDMKIVSSSGEQSKHKQDLLLILGKYGHIYAYDDNAIEQYLLQCQSKSSAAIPTDVMVKLPFIDSIITTAKFVTGNSCSPNFLSKDYDLLAKNIGLLSLFDIKVKESIQLNSANFGGFSTIKNLYITGHSNGAIYFWDFSCPNFLPVLSLTQQSEDDISLSGVALTALYFDVNQQILVSGDQNGMVRIYKISPDLFGEEKSLMSMQGSTKKGINNIIKNLKLIKIDGSVISLNVSQDLRHLAVGSDLGHVSVIDIAGHRKIYERHIQSNLLCSGIVSLQFESCGFHGFEKDVLLIATRDSSILALDSDTGNSLTANTISPKKPSKCILMQVLGGQPKIVDNFNISDSPNVAKTDSSEDFIGGQPLLLICSEKAVYVYSLIQAVQGVKKVHYKKKLNSSSCSWASCFYTKSSAGLLLLFSCGKIEIRSLPDLFLLKVFSIRGLTAPSLKQNSLSDISICSSWNGDLIMVNGDQEIFFVSILPQNDSYRPWDSFSEVYKKDLKVSQLRPTCMTSIPKEKKKGFFSSVIKDIRGSKINSGAEIVTEDTKESIEELSTVFSAANFPVDDNIDGKGFVGHEGDIDIDDIDLEEDTIEERKKPHHIGSKKKLSNKFQVLKAKLIQKKVQTEKPLVEEEKQDQRGSGSVDEIKKKYGFPLMQESSAAKMSGIKLGENLEKLQGINLKSREMQDTAHSFSSMAKQVLKSVEEQELVRRSS